MYKICIYFFVLILIHKIFYIFNKEFFAYFLFLYFTNTYPKLNRITHDPIKIAISGHTVSPAPRKAPEVIS